MCRDCCTEQRRLMVARMVELASTADRENVSMIHDVLLGMSDCERDALIGNMLGRSSGCSTWQIVSVDDDVMQSDRNAVSVRAATYC